MQTHLKKEDMINLGSYYTPPNIVDIAYSLLGSRAQNATILDTSCGYGSFLRGENCVGADIDSGALTVVDVPNVRLICHNSLTKNSRESYGINPDAKLIIVGNPPYNDVTSLIREGIKQKREHQILPEFKTRDLGMSFLRSYAALEPDCICVLHPLSYLIKKANFSSLGEFTKKYNIVDSLVISSGEFSATAPGKTYFPIVIALYEKNPSGMTYDDIKKFKWKTKEEKQFCIEQFDYIGNYITKYPNQTKIPQSEAAAFFWTMRDINALKRGKTFVDNVTYNTIFVTKEDLSYYQYVHVFKSYIKHIPYYLGNCDVFIDHEKFEDIKHEFSNSLPNPKVDKYFKELLGEHYVES